MRVGERRALRAKALALASMAVGIWGMPGAAAAGQGGGPAVTLSPASLTFATQALSTTSPEQTVTLTNSGGADLDITSIAIADHDFSQTNNCPSPLAAGASCAIMVTFSPLLFGSRSATLVIMDNASGSPQSVGLAGTGMGPAVSLSTTVLNFGTLLATTTSAPQAVTLTNSGDAPLTFSSVTVLGAFGETNNCPVAPATLAANGTCTFMVTFTPVTGGPLPGLIEITDDASPVPQGISLSGTGADFTLAVSPTSKSVSPGQSAAYTITAVPVGGFNKAVSFSCSALPAAASCSFSPTSLTLDGINPATATVTVSTTAASFGAPPEVREPSPPAGPHRFPVVGLCILVAGFALLLASRRRRARLMLATAILAALFVVAAMPACGGGGGSSSGSHGTPAGTYTVLVTGSVTGTTIANPVSLTLVVQ